MLDKFPFLKDTRLLKETPTCSVSCLPINVLYLTGLQTNLRLSSVVDFPHCPKEIDKILGWDDFEFSTISGHFRSSVTFLTVAYEIVHSREMLEDEQKISSSK